MEKEKPAIRQEELSYLFIQKEPQTGSCAGMRFYLVKDGDKIKAYTYPDRFCFVKTAEEDKTMKEFPNEPDSMALIVQWLNDQLSR